MSAATAPSAIVEPAPTPALADACDCHVHVYGPRESYPLAPTSPFDPPLARPTDYLEVMGELGVERVVLVQAAAYGSDNRCMVDGLRVLRGISRGVATVTSQTSDAELDRLTKIGVREPIECAEARRTSRRATVEPASCLQPSPAVGGGASGPCGVEEAPDGEPDRRDPEAGHDHAHAALPPALWSERCRRPLRTELWH